MRLTGAILASLAAGASASYPQLALGQWGGITPVILPVGPQTLPCIGVASAGIAVPFFLFLVAMFYLLVPIWLHNFHSDSAPAGGKFESATPRAFQGGDEEGGESLSMQYAVAGRGGWGGAYAAP